MKQIESASPLKFFEAEATERVQFQTRPSDSGNGGRNGIIECYVEGDKLVIRVLEGLIEVHPISGNVIEARVETWFEKQYGGQDG